MRQRSGSGSATDAASGSANRRERRVAKPLDAARLQDMALAYVARFATSTGKLESYLLRKLRERGWAAADSGTPPDVALAEGRAGIAALIERFVAAGYVDDAAYARMRTGSLLRRGYGRRRVSGDLAAAGIAAALREDVAATLCEQRQAALALARKRRIGPFARDTGNPAGHMASVDKAREVKVRDRALAVLLRAGHPMDIARELVDAPTITAAEEWAAQGDT